MPKKVKLYKKHVQHTILNINKEKKFGIPVNPYTIDEVEFALKEAKINNVLSIKYIDKVLNNNKKRQASSSGESYFGST